MILKAHQVKIRLDVKRSVESAASWMVGIFKNKEEATFNIDTPLLAKKATVCNSQYDLENLTA